LRRRRDAGHASFVPRRLTAALASAFALRATAAGPTGTPPPAACPPPTALRRSAAGMEKDNHTSRRAFAAAAVIVIVLAGCGSSSSDDKPAPNSAEASLERKIDAAQKQSKAVPTDPEPLAALAKLHFQAATLKVNRTGQYSDAGKAQLRRATQAWERYLALDPQPVDAGVAQLMSAAYGPGSLDDPKKAVAAQQVLTANARRPNPAMFAQLAQMAYAAGEARIGDRAAARAIELAPRSERSGVRKTLQTAKSQLAPQP